jgi:amidophosphoribosyltransferase
MELLYGIQKMYLLMEQHNRGQDGAGFASMLDMEPGERY